MSGRAGIVNINTVLIILLVTHLGCGCDLFSDDAFADIYMESKTRVRPSAQIPWST